MSPKNAAAVALGRKGGQARAKKLTPEERSEAARRAVEARWANTKTRVREITEGTKELLKGPGEGEKAARTKKAKQEKEK